MASQLTLIAVLLVATYATLCSAGGHHHKHVIIHVPLHIKHHHHTHTIYKHIKHIDHGHDHGHDEYKVLGYTSGGHGGIEDHGSHGFDGGHFDSGIELGGGDYSGGHGWDSGYESNHYGGGGWEEDK